MHRSANRERGPHGSNASRAWTGLAEMDAMRSGGDCDVDTVIYDNACSAAADQAQRIADEPCERSGVQIVFTDLHQVHATADGPLDLRQNKDRRVLRGAVDARGKTTPIGDEAEKRSRRHRWIMRGVTLSWPTSHGRVGA